MINEIKRRNLPKTIPDSLTKENWDAYRKEMIALFEREEYGITPEKSENVRWNVKKQHDSVGGKAVHNLVELTFDTPTGEFTFPFDTVIPISDAPVPLFLYISFTPYGVGHYLPIEEIIDGGYALAIVNYNDVTKDTDDNFESGIAKMYPRRNDGSDWGKIGMWAFAASRMMDYIQTLCGIDKDRIYVAGHSRLGKTAVWCGVQDERFAGVVSNDSGCSGAAVTRGKKGEHVVHITKKFPFWFCTNYQKYVDNEENMPFDQHQLLALVAPRLLCVGSATEDEWADPESEWMGAYLAGEAYEMLGFSGLSGGIEKAPEPGEKRFDGFVGYQLREGTHFLSRHDWKAYMEFFDKHR